MVAARGARRAGRRRRLASVRAGPGRVRLAAPDGGGPRRARGRPDRGARRRARPSMRRLRSPTSSAPCSSRARAPAAADRRRRALPRGRRARGARSSSSARSCSRSCATARRAEQVALVVPVDRSLARRRSRRSSRPSASRMRSSARLRLAATPLGHALLSLLRFAWAGRRPARALRLPALALLGDRPDERRFRRGPAARPRRRRARAGRGGDRAACARRRSSPLRDLRAAESPLEGPAAARRRWCAPPTGSTRRRSGEQSRLDLRCFAAATRAARRARGLGGARRAARHRRR